MRPADSYQSPSMTPPDEPDISDEPCDVRDCPYMAVMDYDLCVEHMKEDGEEVRAERMIDQMRDDGREYPKGYDGTGRW